MEEFFADPDQTGYGIGIVRVPGGGATAGLATVARDPYALLAGSRVWPLVARWKVRWWRCRERGSLVSESFEERCRHLERLTLIVKAFQRIHVVEALLDSIDRFYCAFGHALRIIIADDSERPVPPRFPSRNAATWLRLPSDGGVSAGRNILFDHLQTPYLVPLDDDFVFTGRTRLETLVETMESHPHIDILAGTAVDRGKKPRRICRTVCLRDGVLSRSTVPKATHGEIRYRNFVPQFFIAKSESVRGVRWREEYKIGGEHDAFFLYAQAKGLVAAEYPSVVVNHFQRRTSRYRAMRNVRSRAFAAQFRRDLGITRIVETDQPLECSPGAHDGR